MKVSKFEVEKVLKTLPIGYYVGRDINVTLTDNDSTSYNLLLDKIEISYPTIAKTLERIADMDIEYATRCLLYHEVSHALLTPKTINTEPIYSIFEDERIETILADYYLKVDFKSFVKQLNDWHFQKPTSALKYFFQIVRYRHGPKKFVNRVQKIILDYQDLNASTSICCSIADYQSAIQDLFYDILADYHKDASSASSGVSDTSPSKTASGIAASEQSETKSDEIKAEIRQKLSKINRYVNEKMYRQLKQIFDNSRSIKHRSSSAINAYSGRFDARSVARDDYKYFIQANRVGHIKTYSKIHLNLFIDESGSMHPSQLEINQLLYCLRRLVKENSDFSMTVIYCGMSERIDNDSPLQASGGNDLDEKIYSIYNNVQQRDAVNCNIVLFDGDVYTDSWMASYRNGKTFSAFNHDNCIIVSSYANEEYISKFCKVAKVVMTNNYVNDFYDAIVKNLYTILN